MRKRRQTHSHLQIYWLILKLKMMERVREKAKSIPKVIVTHSLTVTQKHYPMHWPKPKYSLTVIEKPKGSSFQTVIVKQTEIVTVKLMRKQRRLPT